MTKHVSEEIFFISNVEALLAASVQGMVVITVIEKEATT